MGSLSQHCWSRIRFYRVLLLVLAHDGKGDCGEHELGLLSVGLRNDFLHLVVLCSSAALLSAFSRCQYVMRVTCTTVCTSENTK